MGQNIGAVRVSDFGLTPRIDFKSVSAQIEFIASCVENCCIYNVKQEMGNIVKLRACKDGLSFIVINLNLVHSI